MVRCISILLLFFSVFANAQERKATDTTALKKAQKIRPNKKNKDTLMAFDTGAVLEINPLAPAKAAFLSAILPGLGQIYNKKYWKAPIVYAAIGTGAYAFKFNDNLYKRYRDAFKSRRAGFMNDEFYDINNSGIVPGSPDLSDAALQDGQERYQKDRDLALVITIGLYALNIIDANVTAHLKQFNVNEQLNITYKPILDRELISGTPYFGMAMTITY